MELKPQVFKRIRKRNGKIEKFDPDKIKNAILKAGRATGEFGEEIAEKLTIQVLLIASDLLKEPPSVEEIQDIVEQVLFGKSPFWKTARAYAVYREQHRKQRNLLKEFQVGLINGYLSRSDWKVNENANMNYSLQGLNHYLASSLVSKYWLEELYSAEMREAHEKGDFHIHDLDVLGAYCVGWDLMDLLLVGFKGEVKGKVESKPAKHFRAALGQIVNFFYTLQGEAAGAQAFSNFDTLLAPFIYYDKLSYSEVKQALQEFVFNLNVPTRVGFQTPFTNITLDLIVPQHLRSQPVVIGGGVQEKTYGHFQEEMNIFNRALLEVLLEGDANGRVFTFPIPTFNITNNFPWNEDGMELLWEVTAKYGIPYFANFINSEMRPEDARSMCCRLRIDNRELQKRGGGLFASSPLTGSIGVVTINLPRLGYLAKNENDFWENLSRLLEIAKNSLEVKRKVVERFTEQGLYPYAKFYLRSIKERFGYYWKNHFSTIGILGMNECCLNLFGLDIGTEEGKNFALKVLRFIREKILQFQKETGNLYNLEATPAEGASYRLALLDKKEFPDIITAGDGNPFYTNSTNLPVDYSDDLIEVLNHQEELQSLYTGGTVLHLYLGERIKAEEAKTLVQFVLGRYSIPYISLTPTFSICSNCGYLEGERKQCPKCGSECEIYSRVVGYLRPVNQWNKGKREEFRKRKTFRVLGEV